MKETSVKGGFNTFDGDGNPAEKKTKKISFTLRSDQDTKSLLDDLQWLMQYVITKKPVTQADVVREALTVLAKEMDYAKLKKKYAGDLAEAMVPMGRKKRK